LAPEQSVGSQAMGGGFLTMRLYPGDFSVEQCHALVEFIQRIAVEAFQPEFVSRIFARADPASREIILLHCSSSIGPLFLAVNRVRS